MPQALCKAARRLDQMRRHSSCVLLTLAACAWAVACMWPALSGGFLLDDYGNIVFNPSVQPASFGWDAMREAWLAYGGPIGRPLATLSFALNFLAEGMDPFGFKFVNLVFHCVNLALVGVLVRNVLICAGYPERKALIAASIGAVCWGVHPLQVSTVMYVVQRMEVMATTFIMLALILYLDARLRQIASRRGAPAGFTLAMLACGLGLMCKETAALTPLLALGLELFCLRFRCPTERARRVLVGLYAAGLLVSVAAFVSWVIPHAAEGYAARNFTMYERLLTQLRVLPMYLGQVVWPAPSNLVFYYDGLTVSRSLTDPSTTWQGALLLAALAAAAILLRARLPLSCLGIFFFFACHALSSNVFSLELAFEHRNYLALLGPVLVGVELGLKLASRMDSRRILLASCLPLLLLSATTAVRSLTWSNPMVFAAGAIHDAPDSARASYDLGVMYVERSGGEQASFGYVLGMEEFKRGASLPSASALPLQAMIIVNAKVGAPIPPAWWDELFVKFRTRGFGPQEASAFYTLLSERNNGLNLPDDKLNTLARIVVEKVPALPEPHFRYGKFAMNSLKDRSLALRELGLALDHSKAGDRAALQARVFTVLQSGTERGVGAAPNQVQ